MIVLTPELIQSAGWMFTKEYATDRLAQLRSRLEADLDEKETQQTRAAIREMRRILGLDKPTVQEIDQ